eukprot:scaffold44896_cov34-Phaeocystis_antarctica.AAC.2
MRPSPEQRPASTRAENHRLLEMPYWTCEPSEYQVAPHSLALGAADQEDDTRARVRRIKVPPPLRLRRGVPMPRAHTGSRGGPTGRWRRSRAISSIGSCYGEPRQGVHDLDSRSVLPSGPWGLVVGCTRRRAPSSGRSQPG